LHDPQSRFEVAAWFGDKLMLRIVSKTGNADFQFISSFPICHSLFKSGSPIRCFFHATTGLSFGFRRFFIARGAWLRFMRFDETS
jgi:hypothetical protein